MQVDADRTPPHRSAQPQPRPGGPPRRRLPGTAPSMNRSRRCATTSEQSRPPSRPGQIRHRPPRRRRHRSHLRSGPPSAGDSVQQGPGHGGRRGSGQVVGCGQKSPQGHVAPVLTRPERLPSAPAVATCCRLRRTVKNVPETDRAVTDEGTAESLRRFAVGRVALRQTAPRAVPLAQLTARRRYSMWMR